MSFIKYKLVKDPISLKTDVVNKIHSDYTISIPFNNDNTDYQDYLAWVAAGNTAEAAD